MICVPLDLLHGLDGWLAQDGIPSIMHGKCAPMPVGKDWGVMVSYQPLPRDSRDSQTQVWPANAFLGSKLGEQLPGGDLGGVIDHQRLALGAFQSDPPRLSPTFLSTVSHQAASKEVTSPSLRTPTDKVMCMDSGTDGWPPSGRRRGCTSHKRQGLTGAGGAGCALTGGPASSRMESPRGNPSCTNKCVSAVPAFTATSRSAMCPCASTLLTT
eukprot:3618760-Amphidinium_carterae.1